MEYVRNSSSLMLSAMNHDPNSVDRFKKLELEKLSLADRYAEFFEVHHAQATCEIISSLKSASGGERELSDSEVVLKIKDLIQ